MIITLLPQNGVKFVEQLKFYVIVENVYENMAGIFMISVFSSVFSFVTSNSTLAEVHNWIFVEIQRNIISFHETLQDLPLTCPTLPPSEASYFWLHILCGTHFFLFISPANPDFYLNFYRVMVIWTDIPVKLATSVSPVCLFGGDGNNLVFISLATIYLTREILATSRLNLLHVNLWKQ